MVSRDWAEYEGLKISYIDFKKNTKDETKNLLVLEIEEMK